MQVEADVPEGGLAFATVLTLVLTPCLLLLGERAGALWPGRTRRNESVTNAADTV